MLDKINIFSKWLMANKWRLFLLGDLLGLIVFAFFYGLDVCNPWYTGWIWHNAQHDTAQHQLGWEFYRQAKTASPIMDNVAYPFGLSIVFMDMIPLVAIPFRLLSPILGDGFQYFGLWGLACYVLMGGLTAILMAKIIRLSKQLSQLSSLVKLTIVITAAFMSILSSTLLARSFYHPALAGQWIIILGLLAILWSSKVSSWRRFGLAWAGLLMLAVLVHPYFLPMLGAMMLIAAIWHPNKSIAKVVGSIILPVVAAGVTFWLLGGFSLGGGTELYDLEDKGFNLLSFINPLGYSVIPGFANKSTSMETMTWLGAGAICLWILIIILLLKSWLIDKSFIHISLSKQIKRQIIFTSLVLIILIIFAISPRVDIGPITILSYSVPSGIYELWSAFRAAAREIWPVYYLFLIASVPLAAGLMGGILKSKSWQASLVICLILGLAASVQFVDLVKSPAGTNKRHNFKVAKTAPEDYPIINLGGKVIGKRYMVALDNNFRGDISGTYRLGRTAVSNHLAFGNGFYARVPRQMANEQKSLVDKLTNDNYPAEKMTDYIFFTSDNKLADKISRQYRLHYIDGWWFISTN